MILPLFQEEGAARLSLVSSFYVFLNLIICHSTVRRRIHVASECDFQSQFPPRRN
jgi:hypothetical protein